MLRKCVTDFKINCIIFRTNNIICIILLNYDTLRKCMTDFKINIVLSVKRKKTKYDDRFY